MAEGISTFLTVAVFVTVDLIYQLVPNELVPNELVPNELVPNDIDRLILINQIRAGQYEQESLRVIKHPRQNRSSSLFVRMFYLCGS